MPPATPMPANWRRSRLSRSKSDPCAPAACIGTPTISRASTARTTSPRFQGFSVPIPSTCSCDRAGRVRRSRRADTRSRIVGPQDRAEVLTRPCAANRPPLAHADSMSIPAPADGDPGQSSRPALLGVDGKVRAVEDLATGTTHDEADVVATKHVPSPVRGDRQRADAPRGRVAIYLHPLNRADAATRNGHVGSQVLLERLCERVGAQRLRPGEPRGNVAVEAVGTRDAIADSLQIGLTRTAPHLGRLGRT